LNSVCNIFQNNVQASGRQTLADSKRLDVEISSFILKLSDVVR